jgi:hypothetical protein
MWLGYRMNYWHEIRNENYKFFLLHRSSSQVTYKNWSVWRGEDLFVVFWVITWRTLVGGYHRFVRNILPSYSTQKIHSSMALQLFLGPGRYFCSFVILHTVVRLHGRGISPSQGRYLHTEQHTQASIPQVGFEPTTAVFEWLKTVHASHRAATVIGFWCRLYTINKYS